MARRRAHEARVTRARMAVAACRGESLPVPDKPVGFELIILKLTFETHVDV
jgi:hypothetical protein